MRKIFSKKNKLCRRIPAIIMAVLFLILPWTMVPAQQAAAADQHVVYISIYGNQSNVEYDGQEHSVSGYSMHFYFPDEEYATIIKPEDLTVEYVGSHSIEIKGTYPSDSAIIDLEWNDFNISGKNYIIHKDSIGYIQLGICPKELIITANDQKYEYNGSIQGEGDTAYNDADIIAEKVAVDGLVSPDTLTSIVLDGQAKTAGEYTNEDGIVPSQAQIGQDGKFNDRYSIKYMPGKLTITEAPLTITAGSDSKDYDGTELTNDSYTNTALVTGDHIESVTVTGSQTDVGRSENVPSYAVIKNENAEDVSNNYAITYVNGDLTVTPAPLMITAGSDSKVYDSTPLTCDSYTNTTLVTGDHIESVKITGSQTDAGKGENVPSNAVIKNENDEYVSNNYDIAYVNGDLTVTPAPLSATVSGSADKKAFTGGAQTYTGTVTATSTDPRFDVSKFRYTGSIKVTGTQAGDYTTVLSADDCVYDDQNYAINWTIGDPIKLTITSSGNKNNAEKEFSSSNGVPKTGDNTPILGYLIILCLGLFAMIGALYYRKKS